MKIVADLHIHSHYSRATSKNLNFEHLHKWAQLKGVQVVGSGDISHPGWLKEMHEKLVPAEEGLFRLQDEFASAMDDEVPPACRGPVRFLLTGEISSIYKRDDKVRKVHNVLFAPTLEAVAKIQAELEKIGNIRSDGRPILGLDSRDLLEIVLDVDPRCYLIPAHIWTPWFSMLGSKSGFDSVEECFDDLTPHIFALETGLSSDPPMNWRVSNLDRYTLVSNSDAHSPPETGPRGHALRHRTLLRRALCGHEDRRPRDLQGHHRVLSRRGQVSPRRPPQMRRQLGSEDDDCPRRSLLAVRQAGHRRRHPPGGDVGRSRSRQCRGVRPDGGHPFHSLIPLPEILSEIHGVGVNSKRVQRDYLQILGKLGPELAILLDLPLDEIAAQAGERLADGIGRMRAGNVRAEAGYDGEYGVIKLFADQDDDPMACSRSGCLARSGLAKAEIGDREIAELAPSVDDVGTGVGSAQTETAAEPVRETAGRYDVHSTAPLFPESVDPLLAGLNEQQQEAVRCVDRPLVIIAGPGTGKTRTLTHRIAHLIRDGHASPESILAITFTNKAAGEMAERLAALVDAKTVRAITAQTFHAFGAALLRQHGAAHRSRSRLRDLQR